MKVRWNGNKYVPYPDAWPSCPVCDLPALDGHITCGSFECNEHEQRRKRADEFARKQLVMEKAKHDAEDR